MDEAALGAAAASPETSTLLGPGLLALLETGMTAVGGLSRSGLN